MINHVRKLKSKRRKKSKILINGLSYSIIAFVVPLEKADEYVGVVFVNNASHFKIILCIIKVKTL
jgi:type IV secretory pathway component VirB8